MAPPSSPPTEPIEPTEPSSSSTSTPVATPSPIPPPVPVETHPNRIKPSAQLQKSPDPSRLAPEDALTPPRLRPIATLDGSVISSSSAAARVAAAALRPSVPSELRSSVAALRQPPAIPPVAARQEQERQAARAARALRKRTRHQPQGWQKLLWIKHRGFPDNYTDPVTFLKYMQRNPKLRPYEFWPLVADSMVIVQHVCSMVVFVSAYAGIYQDRLSPVAVVVCGTIATVVGWVMWDQWKCEEQSATAAQSNESHSDATHMNGHVSKPALSSQDGKSGSNSLNEPQRPVTANGIITGAANGVPKKGMALSLSTSNLAAKNAEIQTHSHHGQSLSKSSFQSISPIDTIAEQSSLMHDPAHAQVNGGTLHRVMSHKSQFSTGSYNYIPQSPTTLPPSVSPRNQARLKTFKSALLIYFALLGLSPILKSLTKSTSSDSIWTLATWLLIINIFFFDYRSQYVPPSSVIETPVTPREPSFPAMGGMHGTLHRKASQMSVSTAASSVHQIQPRPPLSTINSASAFAASSTTSVNFPLLTPATSNPASITTSSSSATLPPQNTYPSSLATNAAVMASTVLASRLPTTTAVFSLTLFSIQLFGLFPLFRRHLRSRSFPLHTLLTFALVIMASAGLGLILSQSYTHTYGDCGFCLSWCVHVAARSLVGVLVGGSVTVFVTGGCAWWLITLQRYKNVVIGPWDPAKPMLNRSGKAGD